MKLRSGKEILGYDLIKHDDLIFLSIKDWRTLSLKVIDEVIQYIRETFGYKIKVSLTAYNPMPTTEILNFNERNFHRLYEFFLFIRRRENGISLEKFGNATWQIDFKIERETS